MERFEENYGRYTYINLPQIKDYLGINSNTKDASLSNVINYATAAIEHYIGQEVIANNYSEIFATKNVPKDIRKLVDEETLGISLSERTGIDILFGNIPKTGVIIDPKKEAIRIKKNKLLKQNVNSNPSPAVDFNSGKPLLIK